MYHSQHNITITFVDTPPNANECGIGETSQETMTNLLAVLNSNSNIPLENYNYDGMYFTFDARYKGSGESIIVTDNSAGSLFALNFTDSGSNGNLKEYCGYVYSNNFGQLPYTQNNTVQVDMFDININTALNETFGTLIYYADSITNTAKTLIIPNDIEQLITILYNYYTIVLAPISSLDITMTVDDNDYWGINFIQNQNDYLGFYTTYTGKNIHSTQQIVEPIESSPGFIDQPVLGTLLNIQDGIATISILPITTVIINPNSLNGVQFDRSNDETFLFSRLLIITDNGYVDSITEGEFNAIDIYLALEEGEPGDTILAKNITLGK
ncbi:MAG: hypothetical protein E6R13_08085 [Spirochaetes bacterium]|nr:MAG: hypothetical protein E6R13_08085 [Spirochaetota bacterium]